MKRKHSAKERKNIRWSTYYTQSQWNQIQRDFAQSSCVTVNQYLRNLTLKAPFSIYRNRSFDAFVDEIVVLRQEMRAIAESVPLTKEREVQLIEIQQQIKLSINKLIDQCMQSSTTIQT